MNIDDLNYIFAAQVKEGTTLAYFMLKDGTDTPVVLRHPIDKLEELLPMLSAFTYDDSVDARMPRFVK